MSGPTPSSDELTQQRGQYLTEVQTIFGAGSAFTALEFWKTRHAVYPKLAEVALDILAAPASQAYVERLFSVCGLLCSGRRNRMTSKIGVDSYLYPEKKGARVEVNISLAFLHWVAIALNP